MGDVVEGGAGEEAEGLGLDLHERPTGCLDGRDALGGELAIRGAVVGGGRKEVGVGELGHPRTVLHLGSVASVADRCNGTVGHLALEPALDAGFDRLEDHPIGCGGVEVVFGGDGPGHEHQTLEVRLELGGEELEL